MNPKASVWKHLVLVAGACSAILVGAQSAAMEFSVTNRNPFDGQPEERRANLLLKGEIRPGDYDRLLRFASEHNVDLAMHAYTLASPGGDVAEALKIGRLIKRMYVPVFVGPAFGSCASACFILYASAVDRDATPGVIGIHRPYLSPERLRNLSPQAAELQESTALADAEKYLHELRVPRNLIDIMFEHASTEIHWLTPEEQARQIGLRSPWYEEFLIARCGLDKAAEERYMTGDPAYQYLGQSIIKAIYCGHDLTLPEGEKAFRDALADYSSRTGRPGPAR